MKAITMKAMQAKAQGRSNKMGRKMPDTPFKKEVRKSEADKKNKGDKVKNLPSNPKAKPKARYLKKKAK